MLEQNRMISAPEISVNPSAQLNASGVSDIERQGLPRTIKAFSELMGEVKSTDSEGAASVSVFASDAPVLPENMAVLDNPEASSLNSSLSSVTENALVESQSSDMVLNQLSLSTGNQAFQPIETTLNTSNLPGLVNSTEILASDETATDTDLVTSVLPELIDLNENQTQLIAGGLTDRTIDGNHFSDATSEIGTDSSQAPLLDAEFMETSEEVDNISVMPVFGQTQTEVTSATLGSSGEIKLTGMSSAQTAASSSSSSLPGNMAQPLAGSASSQVMNPQMNTQAATNGNPMVQPGTNSTGLDTGKTMSSLTKPAGDSSSVKSEKNDLLASWGTSTTSSSMTTSSQASFNQNSQGNASQNPNQMMFAQMQQNQKVVEQRIATSFNDDLAAAKAAEATSDKDKVGSSLNDLGLAFDKRAQLPLNLQSINTPVRHPQWGQALGQRVVVMANSQIQEAKITLNPEKLGPVQIKLHVDKDQMVHVSMHAQQGATREAMENAIPRLREMLEQAGISFGSLDVGDQAQFEQNQQEQNASAGQLAINDFNDESSEEKTAILAPKTDNIVDYYA